MTVNQKIAAIRELLKQFELDACMIPSTDPHMGEYVPDHWAERTWISGFTGSAGTVVITNEFAGLWTDSRYFVQAELELENSEMQLVKLNIPHTPEYVDWIGQNLPNGARVCINGKMVSMASVRHMNQKFAAKNIQLITLIDLIDKLWTNRPALPSTPVMDHAIAFSGKSRADKILDVRILMKESGSTHCLVSTLDEIAWLTNLRGQDVLFNPLFVSYLLIDPFGTSLYMNSDKISPTLQKTLETEGIQLKAYDQIFQDLEKLPQESRLSLDPGKTNQALANAIAPQVEIVEELGLVTRLKSIKNPIEIAGLRQVMVKDGAAWVKFLFWLSQNIGKVKITELTAAQKLDSFRAQMQNYQGASFHPISSYGPHGSIVHYAVSEESALELNKEGIYLCDTGGHYLDGTTDTTRTITLGKTTEQQKIDFTLALKGTLGVSMLRFPKGTKGYQMDILARKALWDYGMNFGHGTGHGVGFFLNVHEGPQTIGTGASGDLNTTFVPGMVTTVEPAIYRPGSYGMRTENMTLCIPDRETDFGSFYRFETLTLVPIDLKLLKVSLLDKSEIEWINAYHQRIRIELKDHLTREEKDWLLETTQDIHE